MNRLKGKQAENKISTETCRWKEMVRAGVDG